MGARCQIICDDVVAETASKKKKVINSVNNAVPAVQFEDDDEIMALQVNEETVSREFPELENSKRKAIAQGHLELVHDEIECTNDPENLSSQGDNGSDSSSRNNNASV